MAVPEAIADEMQEKILSMGQLHLSLMERFKTEGVQFFHLTAKTHFAIHSIMFSRYIHPALVWCFKGEMMMARTQRIWKSCLAGAKQWQVGLKVAVKYRHGLHLRYKANII
ncbi:unnamed protein product [Polarella glacialis]|uniref:Uncharacterized protein n=1 Tax=Polarella glacialis TaxID=89957 RepID=A0A813FM52_POLGL|nr:unnamed protein product [Polarella glacialis]